jgi:hypothetical protein
MEIYRDILVRLFAHRSFQEFERVPLARQREGFQFLVAEMDMFIPKNVHLVTMLLFLDKDAKKNATLAKIMAEMVSVQSTANLKPVQVIIIHAVLEDVVSRLVQMAGLLQWIQHLHTNEDVSAQPDTADPHVPCTDPLIVRLLVDTAEPELLALESVHANPITLERTAVYAVSKETEQDNATVDAWHLLENVPVHMVFQKRVDVLLLHHRHQKELALYAQALQRILLVITCLELLGPLLMMDARGSN